MSADIKGQIALYKKIATARRKQSEIDGIPQAERTQHRQEAIKYALQASNLAEKWLSTDTSRETTGLRNEFEIDLADTYGMLGGLYRRHSNLDESLKWYEKGMEIEQNLDLDSTYNRVNYVVLKVLIDPKWLKEPSAQQKVEDLKQHITSQIQRRDQWWSWADLGQLNLLLGRMHEANRAYDQFYSKAATRESFNSHIQVLESLHEATASVEPSIANGIEHAIRDLKFRRDNMLRKA